MIPCPDSSLPTANKQLMVTTTEGPSEVMVALRLPGRFGNLQPTIPGPYPLVSLKWSGIWGPKRLM
jgi:hypothetical protein